MSARILDLSELSCAGEGIEVLGRLCLRGGIRVFEKLKGGLVA